MINLGKFESNKANNDYCFSTQSIYKSYISLLDICSKIINIYFFNICSIIFAPSKFGRWLRPSFAICIESYAYQNITKYDY